MKQYADLVKDILDNGIWREPAREGMPRTLEVFHRTMEFDMKDGFPLLTIKRTSIRNIATELLWFLHGDTNIKYLVDHGCNIWNADAFKYYKRLGGAFDLDTFISNAGKSCAEVLIESGKDKNLPRESEWFIQFHGNSYRYGDCGNIYGYQWTAFGGVYNQIEELINSLKNNQFSRYHVVTAWNPEDFFYSKNSALPACHMMFQCYVREGYLDLSMLQRSCDTFLGVPYNIASYAILLHLLARECNLKPGKLIWTGNCVHLYENHLDQAREMIQREPKELCTLRINDNKSLFEIEPQDIDVLNYVSWPSIKAPLSVGV